MTEPVLDAVQTLVERVFGRFKSAREARLQAQALRALVLAAVPAAASSAEPEVVLGRSDKLQRAGRMLPLLLEGDQSPALAASCLLDGRLDAFLFVLPDEVVVTREKILFNDHSLEQRLPVDGIRFVRTQSDSKKVEIASTEGFLSLKWSPDASPADVTYANTLLKSLMTLPPDEVPARPLPTTAALLSRVAELEAELGSVDSGS